MSGINIQINTLIDAMIDAEKCLFHNKESNLMVNSLLVPTVEVQGVEPTETFAMGNPGITVRVDTRWSVSNNAD